MTADVILSGEVRVASPVVIRRAGLPRDALTRLRLVDSIVQAETLVALRAQLAADGAALADDLHRAIGELTDPAVKPLLVGLRRSVFHGRMPSSRERGALALAALPERDAHRTREWVERLVQSRRLNDRLPGVIDAEVEIMHATLRTVVAAPAFQRALACASDALFTETAKWLADEHHRPRRQSLIRLGKYVARAAAKTSPFSTFTSIASTTWAEPTTASEVPEVPRVPEVHSIAELDGLFVDRLTAALCADPAIVARLPLRLNPSAVHRGEVIRFLGSPPAEPILTVRAAPAVLAIMKALDDGQERTPDELRPLIDLGGRRAGQAAQFVEGLVRAGLLHRVSPVPQQLADPVGAWADWLTSQDCADPSDLSDPLDRLRSELATPAPLAEIGAHRRWQASLQRALDAIVERLPATADPSGRRATDLVRDNAVISVPGEPLPLSEWQPALADLAAVHELLGVFDFALPVRLALGTFCGERFGPGSRVPFMDVHHTIATALAAPPSSDAVHDLARLIRAKPSSAEPATGSRLARVRTVDDLRQALRRLLIVSPGPDGVVRADLDALVGLRATWPDWVRRPSSVAWYLQMFRVGAALHVVVNAAHGGRGRGRTRALHLIAAAGGTSADAEARGLEGEPVAAEFAGTFGFTPNVRRPSAPMEIDYPFTVSGRPAGQRIAVRDLDVVHDAGTDLARLVVRGSEVEVAALHLGMMAEVMLPPAARLLSLGFGAGYYLYPNTPILAPPGGPVTPDDVTPTPRVEVGRVVVQRRRWVAPTRSVPRRGAGETDADHLLRLVTWLRTYGIPLRTFVRVYAKELFDAPGVAARRWILDKSHKPVLIDFANWYLLRTFEQLLAHAGPVVIFEEALPDLENADGGEVTELIVETVAGTVET